jgi:NADH-quinone oxidoreductase subunit D
MENDIPAAGGHTGTMEREVLSVDDIGRRMESILLNIGPAHPAMHGIVRIIAEIEGEMVRSAEVEIGYLHRVFEKSCEKGNWNHAIPYVDRLNYVSPLINNFGYVETVEKLIGIEVPERTKFIRVLMSELSRITDHLTCIGATAMELGALTVFIYMIKAREWLWKLIEEATGARVTISYARVGGLKADLPPRFDESCRAVIPKIREVLGDVDKLLTQNRIFIDRMRGIGSICLEEAISHGFTGPLLRACGYDYDVRKAFPYEAYDQVEFDIPVAESGDNYDRYLVRMEEMHQSLRICEQVLEKMPGGFERQDLTGERITAAEILEVTQYGGTIEDYEKKVLDLPPTLRGAERQRYWKVNVEDPNVVLPPKEEVYGNIEGLINHFKIVMTGTGHGVAVPSGEAYHCVEGGNGELGFYIVSEGGSGPHRVRCRGPCFFLMTALHKMIEGGQVADIVPTFGSINMIGGELDR